jgi:hypothetical protein
MVPAGSGRVSPAPPYSGSHYQRQCLRVQGFHLLWPVFPGPFHFALSPDIVVLQPRWPLATGLGCSPFARHYLGNHCCFLFLPLLRCFSSGRWPPAEAGSGGCPIRKSADHSFFAAPRGLSQLCTSFFASRCQGIHHVPFGAFVLWPAHARVQHRPRPAKAGPGPFPFMILLPNLSKNIRAQKAAALKKKSINLLRGASRSRTGDLLLARQAL